MEEQTSPPPDHQLEPAGAPIYYHVAEFDDGDDDEQEEVAAKEEADRRDSAAAIAADEEMAHRLYMQELMEMEWELRDMDRRPSSSGVRVPFEFESIHEAESGALFLGNSRISGPLEALPNRRTRGIRATALAMAANRSAGWNTTSGFMMPGPRDFAITPDHQLELVEGIIDAPIDYHATIFDDDDEEDEVEAEEEADRQSPATAIAADGEMAHRLYMQELMEMKWELRDMDRLSSSSRARGAFEFESIHEAESGAVFLGNSRIRGPLEALADKRFREIRATAQAMAANRGTGRNTTSGFMMPDPRDFATTLARKTTAPPARPTNHDPVSTKRRALLAEANSPIIFAGMEEGDNNSWYESMVVPDEDEKPEQVEAQSLTESLQRCLPRSEPSCNPAVTVATQGHEFSLQDFCQRWGVTPSDVHADEPGPSTKVPPLADHEVPTFHCGICTDTLPVFDLFHGLPCEHKFCASCMTAYVQGRIRASELPIPCPDPACGKDGGVLHPENCKKAIDYAAFGDWGARLAESALPPGRRAYCSNRRCGLLVETSGKAAGPVRAPCPACGQALVRKLGSPVLAGACMYDLQRKSQGCNMHAA